MNPSEAEPAGEGASTPSPARVAAVLAQLEAGVRQRRAELATVGEEAGEARLRLVDLKRLEFVREPVAVSPRPFLGPLLVVARKLIYHLLLKWHSRGLVEQQNRFNQAAAQLIEELVAAQESSHRQLRLLSQRVDALERQLARRPTAPSS